MIVVPNRPRATLAVLLCAGLLLALGCRTAPVRNVRDAPVVTDARHYTVEDMRGAIFAAGEDQGWRMRPTGERRILATRERGDRMAQVEIRFSWRDYDILYRDSRGMDYDGTGTISSRYNNWVKSLDRGIRRELEDLPSRPAPRTGPGPRRYDDGCRSGYDCLPPPPPARVPPPGGGDSGYGGVRPL